MSSGERKPRIAITGIGIFSPIGIGREEFWENLLAGRSGIAKTVHYHCTSTPGGIGGEVKEFTDQAVKKEYLKSQRKSIKVMCREIQLGASAALQAIEDSGLNLDAVDHERMGVEYGANLMFFNPATMADSCDQCRDESGDFVFSKWGQSGIPSMEPLWMLRYLPNMPACHIAIFADARGPNNSVTLDEASPGVAITEALNIMERGAADVMLVGGTGTRIHPVRSIHARLNEELGYDPENPAASCRPFDKNRTGQVASEAAACLVFETEEHAKARGATILGYVTSGASSCVAARDGTADVKRALVNAASHALHRAQLTAADLGHVNANGLGTTDGDREEASAIREILGSHDIPITAQKGYFGNAGAATGYLEIIASLLSLRLGQIPVTLNCDTPDPELPLNLVREKPLPTENKRFLNLNYTRLGQASAVIIEGT